MTLKRLLFPALAVAGLAAAHPAAAAPQYVALGDSYAYGFTTTGNLVTTVKDYLAAVALHPGDPNPDPVDAASLLGLQGYVAPFAAHEGIAPQNILNLAIPGETLQSFYAGNTSSQANLNYFGRPALTQDAALNSVLTATSGIRDITVQLGGNDLLGLVGTAGFQSATLTGKEALATAALGTFNMSFVPLLQQLKQASPNVFVVGYFDPFTPLDTHPAAGVQDPFNGLGAVLLPALNASLQADAAAAGVRYVDIASAIGSNAEADSYDTTPFDQGALSQIVPGYTSTLPTTFPDYHPNPAGYAVIAGQLDNAAAVPESGAWALLTLGLPLIGLTVRRRNA